MTVKASYIGTAPFFHLWVSVMEAHTRMMEARDAELHDSRVLIICPPTDKGMGILARANSLGESYLLCFSPSIGRIAVDYVSKNTIDNLILCIGDFFNIPFGDEYFDIIFANCFFDFCPDPDFTQVIEEIKRVLRPGGEMFSVYMGFPSTTIERAWTVLFRHIQSLSYGCRPVDIKPVLVDLGFHVKRSLSVGKFGFPMEYVHAVKHDITVENPGASC